MPPGRNEPCPCGSGRKYKHCCGTSQPRPVALAPQAPAAAPPWALLDAGRPDAAEAECERLLARMPTHGLAWKCLGIARHMQNKDALAALEAAGRALPDDAEVQYLLGQVLEARSLDARAAECYRRATRIRPDLADAHNDLGQVLLRLGQTDAAIMSCRRALALRPDFAAAIGNLANADRARGDLAAAIAGYRRVIALEPRIAEAHHHLGSALVEAGEPEAAIESLRRALELRPDYASAVLQLAQLLMAAGRAADAIPAFERLLAHRPTSRSLEGYATLLAGMGRFDAATRRYREAVALEPANARLHSNLSYTLHCLGDFPGAIDHGRRALELEPALAEAHLHLGNALLALGELEAAATCYREGIEVAPGHAGLHAALGMAERAMGRLDAAEASARCALELNPGAADTLAFLGNMAGDRGRFAEAETLLNKARSIAPALPEALVGLSRIRRMTIADADWREATERALARGLPVGHAINLHHAAGKYYDDVGEYEAAFRHHRLGNELARGTGPRYDRTATERRTTRTIDAFQGESLEALCRDGSSSERPVFIVGMPRSGTTLAEQILASHPAVHGAGELVYWTEAADLERATPGDQRAAAIAKLGEDYLAILAARSPDASRVVDKLPGNFGQLGLIHAALPGARIIHLERNPLDTCLSIYFQGFSVAHSYATDLGDLAHYYLEYRRLLAHWRTTLARTTLLEVPYEGLVGDPEGWSRRMCAHIGLSWDPRCLEFHRTDRPVLTASNWQVRQPIGATSVGRWRHYEPWLGELRAALGEAIEPVRG